MAHWDMTSISLYGAYDNVESDYPAPAYGHPKDRRTDLKQIQAGIGVAADGGIPVFGRAYDGGAGEVAQVVDTMHALKATAGPRTFLLVGDSKLISHGNVTAMLAAQVTFIAPLAASRVPAGLFAGLDRAAATPVDYIAGRDQDKRFWERGSYRVTEDTMTLPGRRKKDPVHHLRRILVHSTANADAAGKARTLKLAQARTELDTLTRTAGTRYHPTVEAVTAKAADIARRRRVTAYLQTTITTTPAGTPVFAWTFDQAAIDADAAGDGWYALLTNLPPRHRRRRGPAPLQGPTHRGTPLRRSQRPPRRRADVPTRQPADHRPDHRHLPGTAHLLPDRTRGPHQPRPGHRHDRLLHQRPPSHETHRTPHPQNPRRPTPHPSPPRPTTHHPQTRLATGPTARPPTRRPHPTPLAMTKDHSIPCAKDGSRRTT